MADEINVEFKEPKTVQQSLKPVIYFSWLMGIGVCRPGDWKKVTIFLKFFHFSISSVIVAYGIKDFIIIKSQIDSETFMIIYFMNKAVFYVTSYYYVIFGSFHFKKWQKFVERFDSLDKKLKREISINDRQTKINQIMAFIAIALVGPLSLISHVVYYSFADPDLIVTSDLLLYYTVTQSLATNFGFAIMVHTIYQRFQIVNKLIRQIGNSYTAPWIVLKIQRLKDLHYGICGLVNILNKAHGLHLLLSSANSFMMIVATLFRIYIRVLESDLRFIMINNVLWMVYAVQFGVNCYVCTLATREARRTGIFIHEIGLKNNQLSNKRLYNINGGNRRSMSYQPEANKSYEGSCVQNEISYFSSQLEQNPVVFTACEFFVLNNALLQGFIGVIATYLIILIQFYHPPGHAEKQSGMQTTDSNILDTTEDYYATMSEQNYNYSAFD